MKKHKLLTDNENKELLIEICSWIDKNSSENIGWTELIAITELTHKELHFLFEKYMHTTAMTYIRESRKEQRKVKPIFTITEDFIAKKDE